jgi:Rrf2 family nitric oxide-sensitive transcriptional repressor
LTVPPGAHQERQFLISEIAQAHWLSQSNLTKVVSQLVDGGFLKGTRERAGGIQQARRAAGLRVGFVAQRLGEGFMS